MPLRSLVFSILATSVALHVEKSRFAFESAVVPKPIVEDLLHRYDDTFARQQRVKLKEGAKPGAMPLQKFDYERCHRSDFRPKSKECMSSGKESVYEAVEPSFKLSTMYVNKGGLGQGEKNVIKMGSHIDHCVVYSAGVSRNSEFEEGMAAKGCNVHAFDCTISPNSSAVVNKSFNFHRTCIGRKQDFGESRYARRQDQSTFQFKSLKDIQRELGHKSVDLLKFDIEGFEWKLFEDDIFRTKTNLPIQIAFELHTEESSRKWVPADTVEGKGYNEVNHLFLKLYDMGYRVISKEVNNGDHACAEFVVVNINELRNLQEQR